MRRRRPAPLGDKGASVVPFSRAHLVRADSDDAGTAGATALDLREEVRPEPRTLTATTTGSTSVVPQSRPTGPRAPARARRAKAAPEPHDGWTFVLVPPGADARPRTLRISVRRLRFVVASFCVLLGTTVATGALLVLAVSFIPPAQDEARGVELGVFAAAAPDPGIESAKTDTSTPAGIAAASAGAAAPRTPAPRPRVAARPARRTPDDPRVGSGSAVSPSIMESLPVVGEITSRFARARRHPLLGVVRRHDGIDIAAAAGTHIIAPAAGRVIFSGRKFGYGNTIDLDHGNGVITRYAHCRSLMVREGDEVAAGAVIGTVGRSGLATAPHLHYEVRFHGRQMNPLRTPLQSLIEPKQPGPPTPAPVDASARPTPTPDAPPSDSPVPPVPSIAGDTIAAAPPAIARMSLITESPPPSVVPIAPVPARDTTRKS